MNKNSPKNLHVLTAEQVIKLAEDGKFFAQVLLETGEFIKLIYALYGLKISPQTLKSYSSSKPNLLPPPVQNRKRQACYLYPDHLERAAVVLTLKERHLLPIKAIRRTLKAFPKDHYSLILDGKLSSAELLEFPDLIKQGFHLEDLLFEKTCQTLMEGEDPYTRGYEKLQKEDEELEAYVDREIQKKARKLIGWISSGQRWRLVQASDKMAEKNLSLRLALARKRRNRLLGKIK